MVIDELRPDRVEFGAIDSRTSGADARNAPLQRHRSGWNITESRTDFSQPWRRGDHRPPKAGRCGLRMLWDYAFAGPEVAQGSGVSPGKCLGAILGKLAHVRLFLTVPTTSQFVTTIRKVWVLVVASIERRPRGIQSCRDFASISISMNSNARTAKSRLDTRGQGTPSSSPRRSVSTAAWSFWSFKTNRG